MHVALQVVGFLAGVAAVGAAIASAIRAVVLPRASQSLIAKAATTMVRGLFRLRASRSVGYADRDRVMAMLAPAALLWMLVTWLAIVFLGYALMFFSVTRRSAAGSLQLSGSSIVTLGTTSTSRFWPSLLTYSEAAVGLMVVALFIAYFPSIYAAFTRREVGVTLLQVRAGEPPRAPTMLIRYHRIEKRRYQLTDLWRQWEAWFVDVEESHTTFQTLAFFRSPRAERSWVTAAGVLLDAASFWLACVAEHPIDPDAQLCVRAGFLALRRIADTFGLPYDPDPDPAAPVSVSREEWDEAMAEMEQAGVPLVADRARAWADWAGWRINYDEVLLRLARLVEAPLVPWVSDRSPVPRLPGPVGDRTSRTANGRRQWRGRSRPARR